MAFRIRQIDVTATGREIVRERVVDQPRLTLGRAAENDLYLPDLALDPVHAELRDAGAGKITVRSTGPLAFTLDGASTLAASLLARDGGELGFGGTRITLSEEDGVPVLTVRAALAAQDHGDETAGFSVASVLPGRRRVGWIAALLILGLLLALPIATHMRRGSGSPVIGDRSWSPGKLSLGHHRLEGQCETCHVKGFVAVRDDTCRACHKDTHDHAAPDRLAAARGPLPLGRALLGQISTAFNRPGPGACSDCHVEHDGSGKMPAARQAFCADCHATLKDSLAATRLGNASDFGTLHPEFRAMVVTNADTRSRSLIGLDRHPREDNGLTFPHRLHLDAMGGAARMAVSLGGAGGYGKPLTCANCHHASEDGVRFKS
ncbi:MAG: cytochrome c3 family protein, partial [Novosphingobium sp.]